MAPKIGGWLESYITALSEEKYSYQKIIKNLDRSKSLKNVAFILRI